MRDDIRRSPRLLLALLVLAVLALGGLSACGGDDADEQRLQQEQLEDARKEGAAEARRDAELDAQAEEQAELKREIRRLKKQGNSGGGSATPAPPSGSAPAPAPAPSGSSCGPGLSVGPNTTCAFAENVRGEYGSAGRGGNATISVFSPVTNRSYTMTCVAGSPTVCRGGNNATVYITD